MLNEFATLVISLGLGVVISAWKWLRWKRQVNAEAVSLAEATDRFQKATMVQLALSGTVYYWVLLFLLPASVLKFESGHNFYGVPMAGLIAGGVTGMVVSYLGAYLLRRSRANAT